MSFSHKGTYTQAALIRGGGGSMSEIRFYTFRAAAPHHRESSPSLFTPESELAEEGQLSAALSQNRID